MTRRSLLALLPGALVGLLALDKFKTPAAVRTIHLGPGTYDITDLQALINQNPGCKLQGVGFTSAARTTMLCDAQTPRGYGQLDGFHFIATNKATPTSRRS